MSIHRTYAGSELGLCTEPAVFPPSQRPILIAVIDTEEEFDWSRPCSPANTAVRAMREIWRCQRVFESFRLVPMYASDYPVVTKDEGWEPLAGPWSEGKCEVGAHLHPWVTPPIEEELTPRNTYPGNLPAALERRKLETMTAALAQRMKKRPVAYKAGRYGLGRNTASLLESLGYEVDLSMAPAFDYSSDGGPNYECDDPFPFWAGAESSLLFLPTTGAFTGFWPGRKDRLNRLARSPLGERLHMPGVLARLGAMDRLRISPEDFTLEEMKKVTAYLYAKGLRVFTLSFHSPSMGVGYTPYVRSESERERFLKTIADYCEYFLGSMNGMPMPVSEVRNLAAQLRRGASSAKPVREGGT